MIGIYNYIDDCIIPIHKIIAYKTAIPDHDIEYSVLKTWYSSDQGQFFVTHATSLKLEKQLSADTMETLVAVIAEIEEPKLVEYYLKFPKEN